MSIDRDIADELREIASSETAYFSLRHFTTKAANEIEARDRLLDILGSHLETQNEIDQMLIQLEPKEAELLCEYFGWSQYFEAEGVFDDYEGDDGDLDEI